ncbi:hypothetical protein [Brevibacterium sp. 2SA]|uniref:hypothetical protein n=1 Tax=Brevibacterium sp. 2SA TaxID=2502198 RepID=UPI0010F67C25|nr:hypothetical protein [Brevibacterium sp. 2SA]
MSTSSESPAAAGTAETQSLTPSATTTSVWIPGGDSLGASDSAAAPRPGDVSRRAASAGFDVLASGLPPVPLIAHPSGDRWGADAIGRAVGLLTDLHVDRASYGWRLTAAAGRDERLETSGLGEALDAVAEYGEGFPGAVQVSLPGPWTLVTALSLPSGARVLGDAGARRDVVQAYAFGIAGLTERLRRLGLRTVIRFAEMRLDPVLTGTWPTVSGFASLPAISETQVFAALTSTFGHLPPSLLSLPDLAPLRLRGKEIPAAEVVASTGAGAVSVPLASLRAAGWEQLAILAEAGVGTWIRLPADAGSRPGDVRQWLDRIAEPWQRVGMGAASLADFGVLTGEELPLGHPPLLAPAATPERADEPAMRLAAGLRRALTEG